MADIPITQKTRRNQYTSTAGQTIFTYDYPIYDETDLLVYQTPAGAIADDSTDLLTLNLNYTVTGVGTETGGTIVLNIGASENDIITIISNQLTERTFDYQSGGDITASQLNLDLDKDVIMAQQNQTAINTLYPKYQNSAVVLDKDLRLPLLGASQLWVMNSSNTQILAVPIEADLDLQQFIAELASEVDGSCGARLVGYYDPVLGGMTLKEKLDMTQDALPVDDTTSIVKDPAKPTAQMRIDVTAVSSGATRVLSMPDYNVDLGALTSPFPTGIIIPYIGLTAPTGGWIIYSNGTIGNAASGGTIRANADTENLFSLIWDSVNDTNAPVSGGRGASAAADFAANKTIQLPDPEDKVLGMIGGGTKVNGSSAGSETYKLSVSELPQHTHGLQIFQASNGIPGSLQIWPIGINTTPSRQTDGITGGGQNVPFDIRQPTIYYNAIIKL